MKIHNTIRGRYCAPEVVILQLGVSLSFLSQSFSSSGEFDPIEDGGEFGIDEYGYPI